MKHIFAVLTVFMFAFFGFFVTILTIIIKGGEFYGPYVPTIVIGLTVFTILGIYGQMKKKPAKIAGVSFMIIAVVSIVIYEGYQMYLNSLEVVSTQDVDLSGYRPFIENTKAISLNNKSTLKFDSDLPQLDGATALYPVYSGFVRAVYPEKDYSLEGSEIVSSQTQYAFSNLIKGGADIIFMAHPSEEQMKLAERQNVSLKLTPIGREAFVFFVNQNNPVENLTIEQIQSIYSGEITNWSEVGGNNEKIRAFQRPEGSGSQTALHSVMDGKPLMDPPTEDIVSGMGGIISETSEYQNRRNAIGFSFRHFSEDMVQNGKIKHIAIEGVLPTKENIQNETYPIVDSFYAITAGSENHNIGPFLDWIVSEQGQYIVEKSGYVPVK